MHYDVIIIGGGPAGSSVGSLLRRYNPSLKILILEREVFPRDHIGESQLPAICKVLHEMGAWDKVEAAGFPIKLGSTYRWGITDELWQINFLSEDIEDRPRPDKYAGQRMHTAFHVDRGVYDKILLDHARELGCHVIENAKVVEVLNQDDRVLGVKVAASCQPSGGSNTRVPDVVTARHYVDASGGSGILRRAMDVPIDSPNNLRNIALYDYWQDAKWAETIAKHGTRVQIMSVGWGWLWFIPITSTRTSIGLVTPATYLKSCGKRPEDLYLEAIAAEPRIAHLVSDARRENRFQATKDWNYLAERLAGDNWFLVGDACGFADPILTAGLTLAQVAARKVAYTILELERREFDEVWLKSEYTRTHRSNILQHIRFAEYWYSANGCFTDLQDHCKQIAKEAGLDLSADAAFRWLGTGGFVSDVLAEEEANIFGLGTVKMITGRFGGTPTTWEVFKKNKFRMNLVGATREKMAIYQDGRANPVDCFRRGKKALSLGGFNHMIYSALQYESDAAGVEQLLLNTIKKHPRHFPDVKKARSKALEVLETLIADGWVSATVNKGRPFLEN